MTDPETSANTPARLDAETLDYANPRIDLRDTDAAARSLRLGIGCWCAYPILAIVTVTFCFFVVVFAIRGFRHACLSIRNEGCEWRGITGLILNLLAFWPMVGLIILVANGWVGWLGATFAIGFVVIAGIA